MKYQSISVKIIVSCTIFHSLLMCCILFVPHKKMSRSQSQKLHHIMTLMYIKTGFTLWFFWIIGSSAFQKLDHFSKCQLFILSNPRVVRSQVLSNMSRLNVLILDKYRGFFLFKNVRKIMMLWCIVILNRIYFRRQCHLTL